MRRDDGGEFRIPAAKLAAACDRCGSVTEEAETCWYCLADLCYDCWDKHGHCGHAEANEINELARKHHLNPVLGAGMRKGSESKPLLYPRRPCWYYRLRYLPVRIRRWILEDRPGDGLGGPPNNWRDTGWIVGDVNHIEVSARFNNDAHEIWIAEKHIEKDGSYSAKWVFFTSAGTFRKVSLWYLWRWVWGEWLGLRRKLFFWDNHRRCEKMRKTRHKTRVEEET